MNTPRSLCTVAILLPVLAALGLWGAVPTGRAGQAVAQGEPQPAPPTAPPSPPTQPAPTPPPDQPGGTAESPQPTPDLTATHVRLETSLGDLYVELDRERAPKTVEDFLRYVAARYYDGTTFYRVVDGPKYHVAQAGGVTAEMERKEQGLRPPIPCEWTPEMKNVRGAVGLSRVAGKLASGQADFYINTADNITMDRPFRDGKAQTIFGRVVRGMDTLDRIAKAPTGRHPKYPGGGRSVPVEPIIIRRVTAVTQKEMDAAAPPAPASPAPQPETDPPASARPQPLQPGSPPPPV
jgi:peptidyl-prolyl cis-trans isomerase A (cyclophilin A)